MTFVINNQVICLSPTFDLAKQTGSVLEQMSKFAPEIHMAYALRGERGMNCHTTIYMWQSQVENKHYSGSKLFKTHLKVSVIFFCS